MLSLVGHEIRFMASVPDTTIKLKTRTNQCLELKHFDLF